MTDRGGNRRDDEARQGGKAGPAPGEGARGFGSGRQETTSTGSEAGAGRRSGLRRNAPRSPAPARRPLTRAVPPPEGATAL